MFKYLVPVNSHFIVSPKYIYFYLNIYIFASIKLKNNVLIKAIIKVSRVALK